MKYTIQITATAERDLESASDHIEFVLKNPQAADDLFDDAEKQINSLSSFPERYQLADDSVLASLGIRFVLVNGYLAFYFISKKDQLVIIVRFLFQKSNWNAILRNDFDIH